MTVLAPSAFLASAAGTLKILNDILPVKVHSQVDSSKVRTVDTWKNLTASDVPIEVKQGEQKDWDNTCLVSTFVINRLDFTVMQS